MLIKTMMTCRNPISKCVSPIMGPNIGQLHKHTTMITSLILYLKSLLQFCTFNNKSLHIDINNPLYIEDKEYEIFLI